jgi:hypothetical protein
MPSGSRKRCRNFSNLQKKNALLPGRERERERESRTFLSLFAPSGISHAYYCDSESKFASTYVCGNKKYCNLGRMSTPNERIGQTRERRVIASTSDTTFGVDKSMCVSTSNKTPVSPRGKIGDRPSRCAKKTTPPKPPKKRKTKARDAKDVTKGSDEGIGNKKRKTFLEKEHGEETDDGKVAGMVQEGGGGDEGKEEKKARQKKEEEEEEAEVDGSKRQADIYKKKKLSRNKKNVGGEVTEAGAVTEETKKRKVQDVCYWGEHQCAKCIGRAYHRVNAALLCGRHSLRSEARV